MKVYVVESHDTNCVNSVDKVFLAKEAALEYINTQEKIYQALFFSVGEHTVYSE